MSKTQEALRVERALKLALEALEVYATAYSDGNDAITAIREALAEESSGTEHPAQQDIPDLIAGAIGVSRGTAYDLMREALAPQPAQQQEPVLWQILNGVCHAGVRSTENMAREAAAGMQKAHDLGGSLAAFHVRSLYTSPPENANAGKPWRGLTDEEIEKLSVESGKATFLNDDEQTDILWFDGDCICLARAIEAKLREKNA